MCGKDFQNQLLILSAEKIFELYSGFENADVDNKEHKAQNENYWLCCC